MQEAAYSVTFVMGKPPMITVRADTATDWKSNLDAAAVSGALTKVKQINDSLNGVNPAVQPAAAGGIDYERLDRAQQERREAAQQLPDGFAVPPCVECGGPTQLHPTKPEGSSPQSGKPYKRFVCKTDQAHKNTFINA